MTLINWYPGHIAKAAREVTEKAKMVDVVLELIDARLPEASRFGRTIELTNNKPRVLVFTKQDLAAKGSTEAWMRYLVAQGERVVSLDARSGQGLHRLRKALESVADEVAVKMARRGRLPRAARVMVAGMPNVGKSSLINRLAGRKAHTVANKPGVTRTISWVRLGTKLEMLDTPGIIPPKLEDQELALRLAIIGSVSPEAYSAVLAAPMALDLLAKVHPEILRERLALGEGEAWPIGGGELWLMRLAPLMGCLSPGGEPDIERCARRLFSAWRDAEWGGFALDGRPPAEAEKEGPEDEATAPLQAELPPSDDD